MIILVRWQALAGSTKLGRAGTLSPASLRGCRDEHWNRARARAAQDMRLVATDRRLAADPAPDGGALLIRLDEARRGFSELVAGDVIEAQTFGYLAIRSVKGLPLSLPGTTGVPQPLTGGRLNLPG